MEDIMKPSTFFTRILTGGVILSATFLAATTLRAADPKISDRAEDFIREAAQDNQMQIALAKLAEQKARNAKVKQLAQMIQNDHQQAEQKLQSIAQAQGVKINKKLGLGHRWSLDRMKHLSGAKFDQAYTKDMLKDHVNAIKKFEKAEKNIKVPEVKQYAENTLPTLRKHLRHAEAAAAACGVSQQEITSLTRGLPSNMGGASQPGKSQHGMGKSHKWW